MAERPWITKRNGEKDYELTPLEAAQRLNVSVDTIYLWIRTKQLPAFKVGEKLMRVLQSDVDKMRREYT